MYHGQMSKTAIATSTAATAHASNLCHHRCPRLFAAPVPATPPIHRRPCRRRLVLLSRARAAPAAVRTRARVAALKQMEPSVRASRCARAFSLLSDVSGEPNMVPRRHGVAVNDVFKISVWLYPLNG